MENGGTARNPPVTGGTNKYRAPTSWGECVNVISNLFLPGNHIALLARAIASLKWVAAGSADAYGLLVTRAYSHMLAESQETTSAKTTAHEHAWNTFTIISFENDLPLHIRIEMMRKDAAPSLQASRTRAKKHEGNAMHGSTSQQQSTTSAVYGHRKQTPRLQATLADAVPDVEARKKTVSALQHSRGRGGNSSNGKRTGGDGAVKSAGHDRSLSRGRQDWSEAQGATGSNHLRYPTPRSWQPLRLRGLSLPYVALPG